MSLGWTIAFLIMDIIPMFFNYLDYHIYVDRNDLDETKSWKLYRKGWIGGLINAVMFLLLMNLFKLVG